MPAPRDDDARNPMPAHSIPLHSIPCVPLHVDPFPGVCLLSFIGVVCFLPILLVSALLV